MKHSVQSFIPRGPDRRTDINSLKKHINALRSFTQDMLEAGMDLDKVFEFAMRYMVEGLKCKGAAVFLFDAAANALTMQKMVSEGGILQGEEVIFLTKRSPIRFFLEHKTKLFYYEKTGGVLNVALRLGNISLGMLRVDAGKRTFTALDRDILLDFVRELTHIIQNVRLFQQNREHMRMLVASSEISSTMIGALRLDQALTLVVQSILRHLGFDRVRLYLVDKDNMHLKGEVSGDLCGRFQDLSHESYPLRKGLHKLTDVVLGGVSDPIVDKYREIMVHVPLKVKNQTIGLVIADNLLSRQKISSMELKTLSSFVGHIGMAVENARLFKEIEELSITDGLTKLYLYRYFRRRLTDEINRAERYGDKTILIMLDVDRFKTFNDTYGHLVGDTVLADVAARIRDSIRKIDLPARYGGDEFIIFLPHASENIAHQVAQRIYDSIQECSIAVGEGRAITITTSMGIARYPEDAQTVDDLIKKADEALYWGKTHGRNKFTFYHTIGGDSP